MNMHVNEKINRKNAGITAQINGSSFEDLVIAMLKNKTIDPTLHQNVVKAISKQMGIDPNGFSFYFYKPEDQGKKSKVASIFDNEKTTSKADIVATVKNNKTNQNQQIGISLKMAPKGIQVQICPLNNFIKFAEKAMLFNNETKDIVIRALNKFFGVNGFNPIDVLSKETLAAMQEIRVNKNIKKAKEKIHPKYYLFELDVDEKIAITDFFRKNLKEILNMIYKTGFCKDKEHFSEIMIKNKTAYTDTKKIDPDVIILDEYIEEIYKSVMTEVDLCSNYGNFKFGKLKLQMKGSGANASYHSMQFKE